MNESTLYPPDEPHLRKNGSYPSGHTILGWSSALLLSEINPDRADTLLARGYMYGESRVIVGAHWQSDVDAGRLAASAAYAKLHTSERFLEQMRLARQEFRIKTGLATAAEVKAYEKTAKKRAKAK
jgi:acid phosphatase (class A)